MATGKLLLVDDDPNVLSSVGRRLSFEGYDVDLAASGDEALKKVGTGEHDLLIVDVMMPGVDGLAVTRSVRRGSTVPVLMLTALDSVGDKVAGFQSGADDYLVKPFDVEELIARIEALLRRARPPRPEKLVFGDVMMDLQTREVRRGTEVIPLTARSFALLEFFMRRPRHALTREQIFQAVWGTDHLGNSNVIDVNVSYLRDRLEAGGKSRLLHTVRGVGYALRES